MRSQSCFFVCEKLGSELIKQPSLHIEMNPCYEIFGSQNPIDVQPYHSGTSSLNFNQILFEFEFMKLKLLHKYSCVKSNRCSE